MKLTKKFSLICSSFLVFLLSVSLFTDSVFASVTHLTPANFSDCGTDGESCDSLITGTELDDISSNDDDFYTSSIWPDSLFEFSGTAWGDDDANPYLMQFNFDSSITDYITKAEFVFDGSFDPEECDSFSQCRFKFLSSVDGFTTSDNFYSQDNLVIDNVIRQEIDPSQPSSLDDLSVRLLAYGTPEGESAGIRSLIDQVGVDVYIDDINPTLNGDTWKKNGHIIPQAGTATDPAYISDLNNITFDLDLSDTGDAISGLDREVFVIYQEHPSNPGTPYWTRQGGTAYCSWAGTDNSEPLNGDANQIVTDLELSRCHSGILPDGRYIVAQHLYDKAGNLTGGTLLTFVFDHMPPDSPDLVSPADGAIMTGEVLLSDWTTVSDADHYVYQSYHDAAATNPRWQSQYTDSQKYAYHVADASFWWRVKAVDLAGNESGWSDLWKVTIDNIAPIVGITYPSDGTRVKDTVDIRGFVSDANLSHYNIAVYEGGVDVYDFSLRLEQRTESGPEFTEKDLYSWDTTGYPNGEYQIRLAARDLAGNRDLGGDSEQAITVIVDNQPPTIDLDLPVDGSIHSGLIPLQATCDEECDYVNFWWREESEFYDSDSKRYHYVRRDDTLFEWQLDSTNAEKADGSHYPLTDGTYHFYGAGKDLAGNWARTSDVAITVDNTAPLVDITSPGNGQVISGTKTVTIDVSDATAGVDYVDLYYRPDGGTWTLLDSLSGVYTYDWDTTGLVPGDYQLKAEAFDLAGNSATDQIDVQICPIIFDFHGSTPAFGQILITWFTNWPANARVVFDTVPHPLPDPSLPNYGYAFDSGLFDTGKTTFHQILLTGLGDMTTYYYRLISAGSPAAVSAEMSNQTFSAAGPGSSPSSPATAAPSAGTVLGAATFTTPSVLGVSTTNVSSPAVPEEEEEAGQEEVSPTPSPTSQTTPSPTSAPQVLGLSTNVSPLYFLIGGLLISLVVAVLLFRRQ